MAAYHHAAEPTLDAEDDALRYAILGDRLAAGGRDDGDDAKDQIPEPALANPFGEGNEAPASLCEARLCGETTSNAGSAYSELASLAVIALQKAQEYSGGDLSRLVEFVLGVMENVGCQIPSGPVRPAADTSLTAHLHVAAALAGALAAGGVPATTRFDQHDQPIATLISGDISGIQSFIHQTASKGAARAMRARSFYLSALSLVAARYVAGRLGVTVANVLSVSGGNFAVIGPATNAADLESISAEIDRHLSEVHGPSLSVVLAGLPLLPSDTANFSEAMHSLHQRSQAAKARRYENTARDLGAFQPVGDGGSLRACRSCGGDSRDGTDDEDGRICSFCGSLEDLGRQLPRSSFLTIADAEHRPPTAWRKAFHAMGYSVDLRSEPPAPPFEGAIFALDRAALKRLPCSRLLATGHHVPIDRDGTIMQFPEIASRATGRPILAVLKADVDDLGEILGTHFKKDGHTVVSPARVNTFSRFLSLFFEGRLNELAATEFRDIYMVFAGGDDLLAVGPWDQVIAFALSAVEEFTRWTARSPEFHLSAGIALGDQSRPVLAAVREAEGLLDRAKQSPGKNSVALLNHVLGWSDLADCVAWKDRLVALVESPEDSVGRSLLQRLKILETLASRADGRVRYGPQLWRLYYSLRRLGQRHGGSQPRLDEIYGQALQPGGALKLAIAARLAEFATSRRPADERSVSR